MLKANFHLELKDFSSSHCRQGSGIEKLPVIINNKQLVSSKHLNV
jgi:hypothetical protein